MTRLGLVLIVLKFLPVCAYAHPVEPCLAMITQLAQAAKACELAQTTKGQCDADLGSLEGQIQYCKQQLFTEKAINYALEYGYNALAGDIAQSPYRRELKQQRWEYQLMKPNLSAFQRYFPEADHIHDALLERFNSGSCPKVYAGTPDRFRYFGKQTLTRFPTPADQGDAVKFVFHWFSPERQGECYGIPDSDMDKSNAEPVPAGLAAKIVNIPDYFIAELETRELTRVIRCKGNCLEEQAVLAELYDRYTAQYRQHRQLLVCSDMEQRNETRKPIKGQNRSAIKLPEYCPEAEVQVHELNALGLLEQLDQRLFKAVPLSLVTVKTE